MKTLRIKNDVRGKGSLIKFTMYIQRLGNLNDLVNGFLYAFTTIYFSTYMYNSIFISPEYITIVLYERANSYRLIILYTRKYSPLFYFRLRSQRMKTGGYCFFSYVYFNNSPVYSIG